MKKSVILLTILLLVTQMVSANTTAQSDIAARVNLIRSTVITVEQLNARVTEYQAELRAAGSTTSVTPAEVLDIMINDELVLQGAERDGYAVTATAIKQTLDYQKASVEQQLNTKLTDAQFEQLIMQNYGMDMAGYRKSLQESMMVDNYVRGTQSTVLSDYREPTETQIQEFFRTNRTSFMNPEYVRISHIFMPFSETDNAKVKSDMDMVARWIRYGTYTFEELVPKYSKDTASISKGGDIGWLSYDNTELREQLGTSFFDAVFELPVGKPSGVLESTSGYHIVKVVVHTEPKLLSIQDPINPDSTTTVYSYIQQRLLSANQQQAYINAINALVDSLRKQATLEILYK
jgi:parvulin-like peptidyl-prolyl isomerase